jgi:hypothetical protein
MNGSGYIAIYDENKYLIIGIFVLIFYVSAIVVYYLLAVKNSKKTKQYRVKIENCITLNDVKTKSQ